MLHARKIGSAELKEGPACIRMKGKAASRELAVAYSGKEWSA